MSTGDEYCDNIMKQGFEEAKVMVAVAKYPDRKNDLILAAKGFSFGSTYVNAGMLGAIAQFPTQNCGHEYYKQI